jgi:hypothetical protein
MLSPGEVLDRGEETKFLLMTRIQETGIRDNAFICE